MVPDLFWADPADWADLAECCLLDGGMGGGPPRAYVLSRRWACAATLCASPLPGASRAAAASLVDLSSERTSPAAPWAFLRVLVRPLAGANMALIKSIWSCGMPTRGKGDGC